MTHLTHALAQSLATKTGNAVRYTSPIGLVCVAYPKTVQS